MEWIDWITSGQKLIGLILALITLLGVIGTWIVKRISKHVDTGVSPLKVGHTDIIRRLKIVETDVSTIQGDVKIVRDDFGSMTTRMSLLESRIDSLATSRELGDVRAQISGLNAQVDAMNTSLQIIYAAFVRADQRSSQ